MTARKRREYFIDALKGYVFVIIVIGSVVAMILIINHGSRLLP